METTMLIALLFIIQLANCAVTVHLLYQNASFLRDLESLASRPTTRPYADPSTPLRAAGTAYMRMLRWRKILGVQLALNIILSVAVVSLIPTALPVGVILFAGMSAGTHVWYLCVVAKSLRTL